MKPRDKSKLPTINTKVTSICNKQHWSVKPRVHYHALQKNESIFNAIASLVKLAWCSNTKASNKPK